MRLAWRVRRGLRRAGLVASLALWVAGCSTLPAPGPGGMSTVSGRLAVNVAATPQAIAQSLSAAFELSGDAAQGRLKLISPIGTQVALARWAPDGAELDTGDGPRRFPDLAALSREALGEEVPLAALGDWLAGRAWPGAPAEPQPEGFTQLGWRIDLAKFASDALVVAQRAASPAVTLRAKLDR
ncbi:MAG TPA: lipoprotein insertase outer membrane protein LolB [Ideonella sp.]|nr:lipoprotein insertase outer membrane protein LolB [Ideonella sp.]